MGKLIFIIVIIASLSACGREPARELTVSAAANLIPAFGEIGAAFEADTGIHPIFNFGSSGKLAQQIEQGAPADVFAAANVEYVTQLAESGIIDPATQQNYARGRLVLWSRDAAAVPNAIAGLSDGAVDRIAIANPEYAPYGVVAKSVLVQVGLWDALQPKLVSANDVRQTLTYAQAGDVSVALVPLSLVINLDDGGFTVVDDALHAPINQAIGVVAETPHHAAADRFIQFVLSDTGQKILQKYGYEPVGR